MRSWTTFILFGIVLLALIIFTQISRYSTTTHPAVQATQAFLAAVKSNNAMEAMQYLDASNASLNAESNHIIGINFKETMPVIGAFLRQPTTMFGYAELSHLAVDTDTLPHEDDSVKIATVRLLNGYQVCLKKSPGGWKVFYIMRMKEHK